MAKPDPQLLDSARYPYRCDFMTRFQDMDPNRHINNVAFTALFEDLRVRFDRSIGLHEEMKGRRTMIASLGIEYLNEAFYPDAVTGFAGGLSLGRTSWVVCGILTQGSTICAFMRATLVCVGDSGPVAVSEGLRASLERNMIKMDQPAQ